MKHSKASKAPSLLLLSVASGLSPFGMAIVVPAMNAISDRFDVGFGSVQFVISAYLFGLALAQPFSGYLCDRFGRRPVMLAGFSVFTVASLLCALAPTLEWLVLGRFVQAIGVSVGTVSSRAILRDCYDRDRMAEAMSYVSATMGIAPVAAPVIGGALVAGFGYSSIFLGTALMGLVILTGMHLNLRETLDPDASKPNLRDWVGSYRYLLVSPGFVGNTFVFGFVQGSFFSFMAIGAALFAQQFQLEAASFGLLWGLMAICYVIGAAVSAKATPRIGNRQVMNRAVGATVFVGVALVACSSIGELTLTKVLVPLGILMMLSGAITPGAIAGAVANHPTVAGTASGLSSAIALVVSGAFSVVSGAIYQGSYRPIAMLILIACVATALSWLITKLPVGEKLSTEAPKA